MAESKRIETCQQCYKDYCRNCSDSDYPEEYCSLTEHFPLMAESVTAKEKDLKDCPFCGAAETFLAIGRGDIGYQEECESCGARGPVVKTRQESPAAWNTRAEVKENGGNVENVETFVAHELFDPFGRP